MRKKAESSAFHYRVLKHIGRACLLALLLHTLYVSKDSSWEGEIYTSYVRVER